MSDQKTRSRAAAQGAGPAERAGGARPVPVSAGLAELAPHFDAILCDVWGVLHDGLVAFPAAAEALTRFRAAGGGVVLVSNAPRPGSGVVRQLDKLGVPRTAYDAVITSGDLTRAAVEERAGQRVHHIGPDRDKPIFAGLDARFASPAEADYIVCSGFDDDDVETPADYADDLALMRDRGLLMICANPDLVVERGDRLIPCAGAMAQAYEAIGGEVLYAGKPHRPIYEAALARIAGVRGPAPAERVLAIGDAIRTDIAGAARFGIASLLVARGIHAAELATDRAALASAHAQDWIDRQEARPDYMTDTLRWKG